MTKVLVLGENEEVKKEPKKIKFISYLSDELSVEDNNESKSPSKFKNIELVSKGYSSDGLDLMFAYDDDRNGENTAIIFFGHFNDGIV